MSNIENIFKDELWKNIDLKKFSKAYNKDISEIEFGSHLLINELINNKLIFNDSTDKKNK